MRKATKTTTTTTARNTVRRILLLAGFAVSLLVPDIVVFADVKLRGTLALGTSEEPPYSEVFPSLDEVATMVRLSHVVYTLKSEYNFTCADFHSSAEDHTEEINCELYLHERWLGTQVLIVSNKKEEFIAIIFAGTDNIRTLFEDTDILTKPYGNNSTVQLIDDANHPYEKAKVHAGFNNAVFTYNIWEQIFAKTQDLMQEHPTYRLWTTGHSLGGANAILTATAFASLNHDRKVLCVSFGCPQIGNYYWKEYFNASSPLTNNLGIWRVVLAWDLVPRLPEFFYHVGHTIQIDEKTGELQTYYEHYGDTERGYAGVPKGWYAKSHAFLPSALSYHRMKKYIEYVENIEPGSWVERFAPMHSNVNDDDEFYGDDEFAPVDDWPGEEDETEWIGAYEQEFTTQS